MKLSVRLIILSWLFIIFMQSILYSRNNETVDNGYYKDLSDSFIVKPYLAFTAADYRIYYSDAAGEQHTLKYNTLEKEITGISFSWKFIGLSAGIGRVTAPEYKDEDSRDKISYDFRLNGFGRKFCYDIYYLNQDGLFLSNGGKNPDGTLPYYSSMDLKVLSANLYYIFLPGRFSLKAAYDSIDLQKRSAGSFLLMVNCGIITVKDDTSILREENNSVEDKVKGLRKIFTKYISGAAGYSRTFVFFDNFFFNFLVFLGSGVEQTDYSVNSGRITKYEIYPRANYKLALGYSNEHFFCGASLNIDLQSQKTDSDISTSVGFYDSKFYAGYRFF